MSDAVFNEFTGCFLSMPADNLKLCVKQTRPKIHLRRLPVAAQSEFKSLMPAYRETAGSAASCFLPSSEAGTCTPAATGATRGTGSSLHPQ